MWDAVLTLTLGLQDLSWVRALRTSTWVYPFLNAAHIIGFALLFGAIAVVDLATLRRGAYSPKHDTPIVRVALIGFGIALTTGLILFAVRANSYIQNPFMAAKLALILLAGINAAILHRKSRIPIERGSLRSARTSAASSLTFWVATICTGRLVGFW